MKIKQIAITKSRIIGLTAMLLVFSLVLAGTVSVLTTGAWFFDTETSDGNTFAAGSLDLKIDGGDTNVIKFIVENMKPDDEVKGSWTLKNAGTIPGYLDIENIIIVSYENVILNVEKEAGDTTADYGELQDLVQLELFIDNNDNGVYDPSVDEPICNRKPGTIADNYTLDKYMGAGSELEIVAIVTWLPVSYNSKIDNLGMTDGFTLNMTFELGQIESL